MLSKKTEIFNNKKSQSLKKSRDFFRELKRQREKT